MSLRTKKTEAIYQKHLKTVDPSICPFCEDREIKLDYKYWRIQANRFPYDDKAKISDLMVCKRHVEREIDLTVEEAEEKTKIKRYLLDSGIYDCLQENSKPKKTIPLHLHYHLLIWK